MRDPNFDTIPVFNEAVATILGQLYSQHPVSMCMHPVILSDGAVPDDWDLSFNDRQEVFNSTLRWLEMEGFINEDGPGMMDGTTGKLTLTLKGLTAVNGVPPMLAAGEASMTFGEAIREAIKKKAAEELVGLGSEVLRSAGLWLLRAGM